MTKPTKDQAEQAVKLLLEYIGEDVNREGLKETPARVVRSYAELFAGYALPIEDVLSKTFTDVSEYNDVVLLKKIKFTSLCEHHMLPFYGTVDIAYIPGGEVLGISKLARLVDMFSKRLQIQERMTFEIANSLHSHLNPGGVAVRVSAVHSCMSARGVAKNGAVMDTTYFTGEYHEHAEKRKEFLDSIRG
ncbi:MAG: GTP cyclohydrolase I FolE [Rickettsiales bacterium]|nr:MAG: GTP cyclohydrolase I FolE [Rickettsiales bacterium]